jgi:surface antigen
MITRLLAATALAAVLATAPDLLAVPSASLAAEASVTTAQERERGARQEYRRGDQYIERGARDRHQNAPQHRQLDGAPPMRNQPFTAERPQAHQGRDTGQWQGRDRSEWQGRGGYQPTVENHLPHQGRAPQHRDPGGVWGDPHREPPHSRGGYGRDEWLGPTPQIHDGFDPDRREHFRGDRREHYGSRAPQHQYQPWPHQPQHHYTPPRHSGHYPQHGGTVYHAPPTQVVYRHIHHYPVRNNWRYHTRYQTHYSSRTFNYVDSFCRPSGDAVIAGALIGALFGAVVSDGDAFGYIGGGLLGAGIGASLNDCDRGHYTYGVYQSFNSGAPFYWHNPYSGVRGVVYARDYHHWNARQCRWGDAEIFMPNGEVVYDRVRMCRDGYGQWQVASRQ